MSFWYCIYTKPGLEEFVTIQFNQQTGIEVFNPKIRKKRYLRGRMTVAEEKLFPCYLFARFDLSRYYRMVKYTRGVRSLVGDRGGNPYSVDENLITFLKSKMNDGFIRLDPPHFEPGEQVTITDGPLKGLMGIFQKELLVKERVMILLNTISYQARMEIDREFLAKV